MRGLDLTNQRFGKLIAVERGPSEPGRATWRCQCECGRTTTIPTYRLRSGKTRSCGCLRRLPRVTTKVRRPPKPRHRGGREALPEYRSWLSMRERCTNAKRPNFKYYGGRGIRVCPEWDSFPQFLADMGPRPPGTTLDRIDGDAGYEPGNCRWADLSTQNLNRKQVVRTTRAFLNVDAVRVIRAESANGATQVSLAARFGVSPTAIYDVLNGKTWRQVP